MKSGNFFAPFKKINQKNQKTLNQDTATINLKFML